MVYRVPGCTIIMDRNRLRYKCSIYSGSMKGSNTPSKKLASFKTHSQALVYTAHLHPKKNHACGEQGSVRRDPSTQIPPTSFFNCTFTCVLFIAGTARARK